MEYIKSITLKKGKYEGAINIFKLKNGSLSYYVYFDRDDQKYYFRDEKIRKYAKSKSFKDKNKALKYLNIKLKRLTK